MEGRMGRRRPAAGGLAAVLAWVALSLAVGFVSASAAASAPGAVAAFGLPRAGLLALEPKEAGDTWRELRYNGVIGQTDWFTCGPAAVATVLRLFYDVPADEADVLERALAATAARGRDASGGISALALVDALASFGFSGPAYRLTADGLASYFRAGGLPVLLHVTRPEHHFVVAVGLVDDYVVAADPSWGRRIEPLEKFLAAKGFSGTTIVPLPPTATEADTGRQRQLEALAAAASRLAQLSRLGGVGRWW